MNKKIIKNPKITGPWPFEENLVETYPRHTPTKFEVNLADGLGEEVKNLN